MRGTIVKGADQTFLASAPPTVTTKAVSSVKDSTATLNASVNPNGVATTVYFDYGTSTSYGTKSAAKSIGSGRNAANVSVPVTGLAPGVAYHVRVVASNSVGTNAGGDVTFTTTGAAVVRTSSATGVSFNAATLTGSVDPNGHAASWYFQYGPTTSYGLQTPTRSAPSGGARAVSEAIGGLTPGKPYYLPARGDEQRRAELRRGRHVYDGRTARHGRGHIGDRSSPAPA